MLFRFLKISKQQTVCLKFRAKSSQRNFFWFSIRLLQKNIAMFTKRKEMEILPILILYFLQMSKITCQIPCLGQSPTRICHCDSDEKIIDCNSIGLTEFPKLNQTMKGYVGLVLAHNRIRPNTIPWEKTVLEKLPDLAVIDLRGNKDLNCDELERKFERIHVMSSCQYTEEGRPDEGSSTENACTSFWCKLKGNFEKAWLKTYAHIDSFWQKVKKAACKYVCKNRNDQNGGNNFVARVRQSTS